MTAQVDTHPKGGDSLLAPFMGSAVGDSRCAMNTPLARYDDNGADWQVLLDDGRLPAFGRHRAGVASRLSHFVSQACRPLIAWRGGQ